MLNNQIIQKDLFISMLRIRMVEEAIAARYSEQEMRCPVHLSIGQEASAVGVCAALGNEDEIVSTHRCHAHYLAKGGDLDAMLAEIYGKETGCCGGRGGSMHLMDTKVGMTLSLPIVSSSIPIAAGLALAYQQEGKDLVAAAFLGDSSIEEGVFHETMNFAALKSLPVIFILENNLYAVYTHLSQRQPNRPLENLGLAHGVPSLRVDGNDVNAVFAATFQAVARARSGGGPSLLILDTYRWLEHCGPAYDNHIGYRTEEEFIFWRAQDPISRLRADLISQGVLDASSEKAIIADIALEIEAAFGAAKAAQFPLSETAGDYIYG